MTSENKIIPLSEKIIKYKWADKYLPCDCYKGIFDSHNKSIDKIEEDIKQTLQNCIEEIKKGLGFGGDALFCINTITKHFGNLVEK